MTDLPKKYKALVYDEPGKVSTKVVELDMPEPGPGEILVNISHSGVCHSDLGVMVCQFPYVCIQSMSRVLTICGQFPSDQPMGRTSLPNSTWPSRGPRRRRQSRQTRTGCRSEHSQARRSSRNQVDRRDLRLMYVSNPLRRLSHQLHLSD
jgi:hypothetical protein